MNWILIFKLVLTISILVPLWAVIVYCIYMATRSEIENWEYDRKAKQLKEETAELAKECQITKDKVSKRVEFLRMQMQLISEGRGSECVSLNDEDE